MFNTGKLFGKTLSITWASRSFGKSAKDGANIVIAAKIHEPKAMSLDKLLGKLNRKGYHNMTLRNFQTSSAASTYSSVPEVFDKIKEVANAEIVKKIDATYCFEVEDEGKYFVDLKNGDGNVSKGDPKDTADVTIHINQENIIKLFNREIKPATAFMTGQLRLTGDLSKAMALEAVMKASRGERSYHTSAARFQNSDPPPALYESVPEVFDRIMGVATADIVSKVQAIYVFEVEEAGKYYVDFKNGDGDVGKGDPSSKADVTISMNTTNFLKIFNRELSPANAFMTGQIKVSGNLSKALTLEKVMKATREAAEANAK